jgi:hypothetical protein
MKMELSLLNCFWLILPLLVWNLIPGLRINDPRVTSDAHSPQWLLIAENVFRILVFALPVLIPLPHGVDWLSTLPQAGMAVYILEHCSTFAPGCPCCWHLQPPGATPRPVCWPRASRLIYRFWASPCWGVHCYMEAFQQFSFSSIPGTGYKTYNQINNANAHHPLHAQ